jgi:hypothetical protein
MGDQSAVRVGIDDNAGQLRAWRNASSAKRSSQAMPIRPIADHERLDSDQR